MTVKARKQYILFFALSTDAECTFELYKQLINGLPVCEDEVPKLYNANLPLAEPNDKMTIEDAFGYWTECKGELWLLPLTVTLYII